MPDISSRVPVMRLCFSEREWDYLMRFEPVRYAFWFAQSPAAVEAFIRCAKKILDRDGKWERKRRGVNAQRFAQRLPLG